MNEQYFERSDGGRTAFRHAAGRGPALVFLPGYMSDMDGGKASALFDWAAQQERESLLLDYSGCGSSDGDFADGTLSKWRDEIVELVEAQVSGPVVLVGSSMGGWLMLLVAAKLGHRLAGLVGIAAAPDFSDWGYDASQKRQLEGGETVFEDNPYGPDPTPTYAGFWRDAQTHRLLASGIDLTCPVRLLHGQRDADVPWNVSMQLAQGLRSDAVQVHLVKDGDHRLSRPQDIRLLLTVVANLLDSLDPPL